MKDTKIEWTHHTFNPWQGCTRVSPGCQHCYAETMMDKRFGKVKWGPQGERVRTSPEYWRQPAKWNREAEADGVRRRVFVASLADVFEDKRDQRAEMDEWRDELFHFPHLYDSLDWLFLTKRPENVMSMVHPLWLERGFPPNVWIGTSVENQEQAHRRIPELLHIPAAVRFLSCEPLLGPVDLGKWMPRFIPWHSAGGPNECEHGYAAGIPCPNCTPRLHWVIVGGESGRGARPMHPEWAREIRDQCQDADVPYFFKQWGEWSTISYDMMTSLPVYRFFNDEKQWIAKGRSWVNGGTCVDMGGKVLERGADFHEAQYPVCIVHEVGKKAAGRLLDGCEWNEFPVSVARGKAYE